MTSRSRAKGRKGHAAPEAGEAPEETAAAEAPEAAGAAGREPRITELETELARAREEAASAADRALRTLAEFDNYRKRSERERREATAAGAATVLRELFHLADDFDRALAHAGDGVPEAFLEGMRLVARRLHEVLDRHGVARIDSLGQPFDPELHEALSTVPHEEAAPNTVLQEIQPGYRMGDRVLRPAQVIVSRAAGKPASAAGSEGADRPDDDENVAGEETPEA